MSCLEHNDEDEQHEYEDADHNGRAYGHAASKCQLAFGDKNIHAPFPFTPFATRSNLRLALVSLLSVRSMS